VGLTATAAGDNRIDLAWSSPGAAPDETASVYRSFGGCPGGSLQLVASGLAGTSFSDTTVSGDVAYSYRVALTDASGLCASAMSACAEATTTGVCNAPPVFAGLGSVESPGSLGCALDLDWSPAGPNCGAGVTYSVYRGETAGFTPGPGNRLAAGIMASRFSDFTAPGGVEQFYVVRAIDTGNGVEDGNRVERSGVATGPLGDGTFAAGAEVGDPQLASGAGAAEHVSWHLSTARAHSGSRSYASGYENGQCLALATPPLALTAGEASSFRFWTLYDIQTSWDGGVVEISNDGGATWSRLALAPPYPGSFNDGSDACGYPPGTPALTGAQLSWIEHVADLSGWNGQTVVLRFRFSTDSAVSREGWYLDDLAVTHAQVPGVCVAGLIFQDGFESGDAGAWSLVIGE
jgi:hypothetical protein